MRNNKRRYMKKEKIISDIKTAGIVTMASLTLSSCGPKELTPSQLEKASYKTDSAVNKNSEYKITKKIIDLCSVKAEEYRDANKNMVKKYSVDYIKRNIKNMELRKFMLASVKNNGFSDFDVIDDYENDSIGGGEYSNSSKTIRYIRRNQRWFNDMMLYLSGQYNDNQLLNSDFFKVVNNPVLKKNFEHNAKRIEQLNANTMFATQPQNRIYGEIFNKQKEEIQRKR